MIIRRGKEGSAIKHEKAKIIKLNKFRIKIRYPNRLQYFL